MSERRCVNCGMMPTHCKCAEPQEGASNGRPSRDTSASITAHRGSGAPSCDSLELAAIRVVVERGDYAWPADALLRMVDELTRARDTLHAEKLKEWRRANGYGVELRDMTTERDELRAKLELQSITLEMQDTLTTQQLEVITELRAKLAEAEKNAQEMFERSDAEQMQLRERAEAAEASVKELEAKLEDMVVVTDDPVCFND